MSVDARRRPDPFPFTFGDHALSQTFVIAVVACHYASIGFFVLPRY